jgi:hypothetical protein
VTSTILGYNFRGTPINGMAPKATVIPVKVLGQAGFGWSSMIANPRGDRGSNFLLAMLG